MAPDEQHRMKVDTLEYVKRLEAAGVDRRQAEAHAAAVRDTLAPQLATKADLDAAVTRLDAKIDTAVTRLDAKIDTAVARLEAKMAALDGKLVLVHWMLGFNLIMTGGLILRMLR
jgi:hypothetical protein